MRERGTTYGNNGRISGRAGKSRIGEPESGTSAGGNLCGGCGKDLRGESYGLSASGSTAANGRTFGGRERTSAGESQGKHAFHRSTATGTENAGAADGRSEDSLPAHEGRPDEILLSLSVSAGNE